MNTPSLIVFRDAIEFKQEKLGLDQKISANSAACIKRYTPIAVGFMGRGMGPSVRWMIHCFRQEVMRLRLKQ